MCIDPFVARQRLDKHVPTRTNTRSNRRTVRRVCLWVCQCIPLLLLGKNSINTFPRKQSFVGGVVFYAVRVISKESRRLVLPELLVFSRSIYWQTIYAYRKACEKAESVHLAVHFVLRLGAKTERERIRKYAFRARTAVCKYISVYICIHTHTLADQKYPDTYSKL
jgi:hypothetical protein